MASINDKSKHCVSLSYDDLIKSVTSCTTQTYTLPAKLYYDNDNKIVFSSNKLHFLHCNTSNLSLRFIYDGSIVLSENKINYRIKVGKNIIYESVLRQGDNLYPDNIKIPLSIVVFSDVEITLDMPVISPYLMDSLNIEMSHTVWTTNYFDFMPTLQHKSYKIVVPWFKNGDKITNLICKNNLCCVENSHHNNDDELTAIESMSDSYIKTHGKETKLGKYRIFELNEEFNNEFKNSFIVFTRNYDMSRVTECFNDFTSNMTSIRFVYTKSSNVSNFTTLYFQIMRKSDLISITGINLPLINLNLERKQTYNLELNKFINMVGGNAVIYPSFIKFDIANKYCKDILKLLKELKITVNLYYASSQLRKEFMNNDNIHINIDNF